ncbi:tail fiber/spike domain-containing protein [Enterobacter hormaechei]|uniref:tail fiber/spike domain-containing protein n=1 Tax=Enterobacter hormaechei TaxID=158836 RepID=UPI001F1E78AD|nr:hypothetical protein [Enterobacter hormaechei]UJC74832.1 hypothetical protein J4O68_05900 [Enterobacter hormaechei]
MTTTPTQNSVPSESPIDLKFNAGKIDEFVTSFAEWYIDRFGNKHYTIEGLKRLVLQQIYNLGWAPVGTFQGGAVITAAGDIIQDTTNGVWYRWDDLSTLPKTVPSGSTPASTGGIGDGKWLAVDVSDVLRKQLSEENGSTLIGGSVYVVDYFSDAKVANAGKSKYIMTRGHHEIGVGAATYFSDGTTGSPSTGNELKFYDATGNGWYLRHDGTIDCRQFGVVADGSDETTKLQLWLDCCAQSGAEAYIPVNVSPSAAGLICTSQHNGLKFKWHGYVKHWGDGTKPATVVDSWDPSSGYVLYLKEVSDLTGEIRIDGVRTSKIADEHIHNIHSYGGKNHVLSLFFKETRGDGIYLNAAHGNQDSTPPSNMTYPLVESVNSDYDGRNAMSIICADGVSIGTFVSYKHGGRIGTVMQPGGLDIEPNYSYQPCTNIQIDSYYSRSCGTGFTIFGKVNTGNMVVRNISISKMEIVMEYISSNNNQLRGSLLMGADGLYIGSSHIRCLSNYTANSPIGAQIDACYNADINISTERFYQGAAIGIKAWTEVGGIARIVNSKYL